VSARIHCRHLVKLRSSRIGLTLGLVDSLLEKFSLIGLSHGLSKHSHDWPELPCGFVSSYIIIGITLVTLEQLFEPNRLEVIATHFIGGKDRHRVDLLGEPAVGLLLDMLK
jgi:hypothetical protein